MGRLEALTVAIVDDDDDVRTALSRLLTAMGHRVAAFASGEDFEAGATPVDCAVVDMRLPGVSGLELRDRLRHRPVPVPVVLVTGDAHRLAVDLPPSDTPLVSKPFDEDTLSAAIADAMAAAAARHAD